MATFLGMRVLVVGGRGYLGSRTVEALSRIAGLAVSAGSRAGPTSSRNDLPVQDVVIDLTEPSTFHEMRRHDVVINASDTLAASPVRAVDYALYNGVRFVEAAAHAATMEELLRRTRGPAADPDGWNGTVLLGMGLFPGLSNLVARQLADWVGLPDRMDVIVRLNPLTGAGPGLVEVMVRSTQEEAVYYEDGVRVTAPPIRPGVPLFTGRKTVSTVGVGLPEASMLHASLGLPTVATYVTTVPTLPGWISDPLLRWMPRGPGTEKAFVPLFRRYLRLIRTRLFRNKPAFVEVNAVTGEGDQLALRTDDGLRATAHGLAAAALTMASRDLPVGAFMPDELFTLGEVMDRMLASIGGDFHVTLHSTLVDGSVGAR